MRDWQPLIDRIQNYLGNGGFFNPEHMEHDKVRDLLLDIRDALVREISESREVMPSDPNQLHLSHDHRSVRVPDSQRGASVDAGAQHPAENTARGISGSPQPQERPRRYKAQLMSGEWVDVYLASEVEDARSLPVSRPAELLNLTVDEICHIIEAMQYFCAECNQEEFEMMWRPCMKKLEALKASRHASQETIK